MDLIQLINQGNNGLNDLYYVLAANNKQFQDLESTVGAVDLVYPAPVTLRVVADLSDTVAPYFTPVTVSAYQSILDVCVQQYGNLNGINKLLMDNNLSYNDYLTPGQVLKVRTADNKSKTTNTLFALAVKVSNFDRDLPADSDIYLGTEDGAYIGPTTSVKIKIN